MASKIKVDQIEGAAGTTVTLPSGQTLDLSSGTVTLPNNAVDLSSAKVTGTLGSANLPTVPATKGGTGLTSLGSANQVLRTNSSANALEFADPAGGGLANSGSGQNVYKHVLTSTVNINVTSYTDTGMDLSGFSALSANTDFIVHFIESRREESWNQTGGLHMYSVDNGSNWIDLNETMDEYDTGSQSYGEASAYQTKSATYYLSFTSGQTPRFKVRGRKFGGSNAYMLNYTGNGTGGNYRSSIIAIAVTP
jgi:hypothetical protein